MRSAARIVAEHSPAGTRLAVLRGEAPLLPRRTGAWPSTGAAEVHLVGGAAGPLGGDELRLDLEVGPGAHLIVRTVAASIVLPGPGGAMSSLCVRATVADGARLEWLPEPVVAVRGCHHLTSSTVELSGGAGLVWREELVCGRHGEECGDLTQITAVCLDGAALWQQELAVGPRAPAWRGPAILGGAIAVGSLLVVDPARVAAPPPLPPTEAPASASTPASASASASAPNARVATVAKMALAGPAVLTSAVAPDAHQLRRALHGGAAVGHGHPRGRAG